MAAKKTNRKTEEKSSENFGNRLHRSSTNRIIGGVAGGIGEAVDLDPTLIRIIFILLFVFGGSGFLIYLLLWIIMPSEPSARSIGKADVNENIEDIRTTANQFSSSIRSNQDTTRTVIGAAIILFGLLFLFDNFGIFDFFNIFRLWPVILVIIGLAILAKK